MRQVHPRRRSARSIASSVGASRALVASSKMISSGLRYKARAIATDGAEPFLTVGEAYYLATSGGARYFGDMDGFAPGNPLHALVLNDAGLPPSARTLTVKHSSTSSSSR